MPRRTRLPLAILALILLSAELPRAHAEPAAKLPKYVVDAAKAFFEKPRGAEPVQELEEDEEAFAILDGSRKVIGWILATDRMPPDVKGKRGPIGVLVALDRTGTILGVRVQRHKETERYFRRIGDAFYEQFAGRSVQAEYGDIDMVTRATVSSKAMTKDIFESTRTFLARPSIRSQLDPPPNP